MSTVTMWILAVILILTASPTAGSDTILVTIVGVTMVTYASVGALVARTSPGNPIGWLLSAVGFALAVWMFGLAYAQVGFQEEPGIGTLPVASTVAWIAALSLIALLPVALPRSDGHLTFEVADEGAGFDPAQARGSGLANIRDRLEALGGSLLVEAAPDEGTRIRGRIPVEAP
ncbi:MAG: hypothetical protein WB297_11280 [Actinomycetota bacterium]